MLTDDVAPYLPKDQVDALDRELSSAGVHYKIVEPRTGCPSSLSF